MFWYCDNTSHYTAACQPQVLYSQSKHQPARSDWRVFSFELLTSLPALSTHWWSLFEENTNCAFFTVADTSVYIVTSLITWSSVMRMRSYIKPLWLAANSSSYVLPVTWLRWCYYALPLFRKTLFITDADDAVVVRCCSMMRPSLLSPYPMIVFILLFSISISVHLIRRKRKKKKFSSSIFTNPGTSDFTHLCAACSHKQDICAHTLWCVKKMNTSLISKPIFLKTQRELSNCFFAKLCDLPNYE